MSYLHCSYCEIREQAKTKEIFEAIQPIEGKCPDCGAWLDKGQQQVQVNGYTDIFKGAVMLMNKMVTEFNYWLDYFDIDVEDYIDEIPTISVSSTEIIEALFLPYYGGTTKRNFKKALEIEDEEIEFVLKREVPD